MWVRVALLLHLLYVRMMRNLLLDEGSMIRVESASLPVATYSKFQPQNTEFLEITNPKAVLENALRQFACLTAGDVIAISYNCHVYEVCVLETRPGDAVSIIECDMNVEFAAPVGYREPERCPEETSTSEDSLPVSVDGDGAGDEASRFPGGGFRLDGKAASSLAQDARPSRGNRVSRGIPAYDYELGTLSFIRTLKPAAAASSTDAPFAAFDGLGQSLRQRPPPKSA